MQPSFEKAGCVGHAVSCRNRRRWHPETAAADWPSSAFSALQMRIAFLLPKILLAGGIYIVLEHARGLVESHGHDVAIILTEDQTVDHDFPALDHLDCLGIEEAAGQTFDIAVATWWHTVFSLPRVKTARHAHFIQNLEDRFYRPAEVAARAGAGSVQTLPVAYVATAGWLERQLRALRPDAQVYCVRSGIDKEAFRIQSPVPTTRDEPLRIVIEGPTDVWFKGVPDALEAVARMQEPHYLTVVTGDRPASPQVKMLADRIEGRLSHGEMATLLGNGHLLLKLSRVEGMSGPPLEAFHRGATAVLTPVTGHDEYAVHGSNCQIVGFDDIEGTARTLDLLARDRRLLHELRSNAVLTARQWPDWEQSTGILAGVIEEIAGSPAGANPEYTRQLILETEAAYSRQLTLEIEAGRRRPLSFSQRLMWVAQHEGAKGLASRGARKGRVSIGKTRNVARARMRSDLLDPRTPDGLTIKRLDRPGLLWAQSVVRTVQLSREHRHLCLVRHRRGLLSCRYPNGYVTLDGMGQPSSVDQQASEAFFFDYTPRPGDIVVDAGAGSGTEVLTFSRLVGQSGKVIAVEAHPEAFRRLHELCQVNGLLNVVTIQAALSDAPGFCEISDLEDPVLNTIVGSFRHGVRVPADTLDRIIERVGVDSVDFLKMNIEGGEAKALEGFRSGIERTWNVSVGCHDFLAEDGRGTDEMKTKDRVRAYLEAAGFDVKSRSDDPLPWFSDYLYGSRLT